MADGAQVRSVDALREFRAAMQEFREVARTTVSGAHSDVQRAIGWLRQDQVAHWERERRKWEELVTRAKSELYRKQVSATDGRASDADERRALERAEHRLRHVHERQEQTRRWVRQLERDSNQFRAQMGPFSTRVDAEFPKAEIRLEKLTAALEAYLATTMPSATPPPPPVEDDKGESS